jgi:hypothetical protein
MSPWFVPDAGSHQPDAKVMLKAAASAVKMQTP